MAIRVPAVLRDEPAFRRLWSSQVLSVIGDQVAALTLPFAVLAAGGGAGAVGLVVAAQFVPFLLFALVGGVVADRWDRRRIMIASDALRLGCQAAAGALLLSGEATPLLLAPLAFLYGSADAFFTPAFVGMLPQTVSRKERLQDANAMRGLSLSAGSVAGPVLAGGLIATLGAGGALLFDAATFAVSIAFLLRVRVVRAVDEPADPEEAGFLDGLRGGWREVRSRRWVQGFLVALAVYHVVVLPSIFVLGPVLADAELGGASRWAAVVAAFGAGALAGNLVLLRWRPPHALKVSAACLVLASAQPIFIGSGLGVPGIAALEFVAGMGVTGFFVLWETSLQEHMPAHALSRVASYDYLASAGLMPLGLAVAGPVSEVLGLDATLIGMSVVGIACALALLALPEVRSLPRGGQSARPGTATPAS